MSRRREEMQTQKALEHARAGEPVERVAVAHGTVKMNPRTLERVMAKTMPKGNVIELAKAAGLVAARKAGDFVAGLGARHVTHVAVNVAPGGKDRLAIVAEVKALSAEACDTEALAAVSAAALTVFSLCRDADPALIITDLRPEGPAVA
ncbi:MAG TPA: cyclic pyranopterin monophosphate synthase MoaC [Candidatus Brocadiia bacterium]|nr:cyclic pyranopterin monophosphate synthase MoaC [Candidatus Brocadiia bacterium]